MPRDLLSGTPYLFLTRGLSLTGERMRIGILSDTHDNLPMVEGAVARLNGISPDLVLHAGDFVSPFVIPRLARLSCPCIGVFGNNDGDRILLAAKAREAGNVEIHGCFTVRQADGRSIALLHGHEPGAVDEIAGAGIFDVVVHGHTHRPSITERGGTLVVNPGEVCGYLTEKGTIAVLETGRLEAKILEISQDSFLPADTKGP
ncbi:MAG: metallophosphoesterase [Methanomicrobiales archaeon]|nr:metallophosphoesterase [Methanomicrobiales archaeon]